MVEAKSKISEAKRKLSIDLCETPRKKGKEGDEILDLARKILLETWGFQDFKSRQGEAIARLITGENAAVIFPTGGGKSLVYQVPALAFDEKCGRIRGQGLTLIICPLIALMKVLLNGLKLTKMLGQDQVDALRRRGVCAAALDSTQSRQSWLDTHEKIKDGRLKILYVAPERLNNEGFIQSIKGVKLRMIAVDEAHCISEWGHAFRPDYLKIARFVKESQAERVLCLTATATQTVANDICDAFDIPHENLFRTSTYRSNLQLLSQSFESTEAKSEALVTFFHAHKGSSIVYVRTREQTTDVTTLLTRNGFDAHAYHAGMQKETRTIVQDKFMTGEDVIIVATIAFGMGIDKAEIRNVVHYTIPKSLEGYSQEIGRAGRDGLQSICMMYLCAEDLCILEQWSRADLPSFQSVKGLVTWLIKFHKNSKAGEIVEHDLNKESKTLDIRRSTLDLIYTQLEIRFNLLRAMQPKYETCKYTESLNYKSITTDKSQTAKAIRSHSKSGTIWTHVNLDRFIQSSSLTREEAVRKLQQWHDAGAIELQFSGVVQRFRIIGNFPATQELTDQLIENLYEEMKEREQDNIVRVKAIIELVTSGGCLCRKLANHFGDEDSVPKGGCGHCHPCITGETVKFNEVTNRRGRAGEERIKSILSASKVRDDARFLAKIAFGIPSPRITTEKMGRHALFGSMNDCDFDELVEKFCQFCD